MNENVEPWDIYEEISYHGDPRLISCVSHLRHYINCHGVDDNLTEWLEMDLKTINEIVSNCFGHITIADLRDNASCIIEDCRHQRKLKDEAIKKNNELIEKLSDKRNTMNGIGTRKVKLFLNKKIKEGDIIAEIYRTALETEDNNIKAKDSYFPYSDKLYGKKEECIDKLIALYQTTDFKYGFNDADLRENMYVVFFKLPLGSQISFHSTVKRDIPSFDEEWDGKVNSTLDKIEKEMELKYFKHEKKD